MNRNVVNCPKDKYYFGPSKYLTKRISLKSNVNRKLDFSIEGGQTLSNRIRISSVIWNSDAYAKGLRPNDQILSVNGISFENLSLSQANQILHSFDEFDLTVRTVRLNDLDGTLYDWFDGETHRSSSPPPSTYLSSNVILPYPEKFIEIRLEKDRRLGLVIRGGVEYGLGIFISGVDQYSLSDQHGIRVGDQILSVNEIDFRHISHRRAVQILKSSNLLKIHLRRMNKLPQPKTRNSNDFLLKLISFETNQRKIQQDLNDYFQRTISIEQLFRSLLQILDEQNQFNRNEIFDLLKKQISRQDIDRLEILILKDDFNRLKLSHDRLIEQSQSPVKFKANPMSKSLENLSIKSDRSVTRPRSLTLKENNYSNLYPFAQQNPSNSLRKSKSVQNVDENDLSVIDEFLQDYSDEYPITIHKVRSTLGIAIEGGFEDRIPLPRIVYMQPDGSAYISSGLRVGHVITSVNGRSMKGLAHRDAALVLAHAFKEKTSSQIELLVVQPIQ